jgi:hypothetical protein
MNTGPYTSKEFAMLGEARCAKLAQQGYEAYAKHVGWKDAGGTRLSQWEDCRNRLPTLGSPLPTQS